MLIRKRRDEAVMSLLVPVMVHAGLSPGPVIFSGTKFQNSATYQRSSEVKSGSIILLLNLISCFQLSVRKE